MLPTNLFIDAPEMQDVSMHRLSNDIEMWPEEIVTKLHEHIPDSVGMNVMVKFMHKDEENGTATGSIMITAPDKSAVAPVIVKDFQMFPVDIMIAGNKLLPLTPDYFKAYFSSNEVFNRIEEYPTFGGLGRFEDANLWSAIYPPSLGRYAYASAGYPLLDEISDTIDGTSLKEEIVGDEKTAALYYRNGHSDLIKKVANLQPVNMNEFRQGVDNLIPRKVLMLRAESPHKYSLLSSSDKVFSPAITPMTRSEARHFMSTLSDCACDDINDVDQNGEKFLRLPEGKNSVILAKSEEENIERATEYGHYSVKSKTGVSFEGVVIPMVIGFNQAKTDLKIFLGPGMSSIQPEFYGVGISNSRFQLNGCAPKVGQTGTFVYQPDKSHALATVPVTIESVIASGCGQLTMRATDMMGVPYKLEVSPDMTLQRIAKCGDKYILPARMKWMPMDGFEPLTDSAESYAVKTAGARLTGNPTTLISTGFGQYAMRGVTKYAQAAKWDATNLDGYQVKFLLASLGTGQEKIAQIMNIADRVGHAEIHRLNYIPLKQEKIAQAKPLAIHLMKIANKLKSNLIKEASYVENAQTVDALLSLNFVSPDNIAKFVGKIPHFKAAISNLASCLLASRIGLKEIPESATSTAMHRLMEVVNGLEMLRSSQEIGGS